MTTKKHVRPYCLNCDSEKIATVYIDDESGREIDEAETLANAVDELSVYLAALANTYGGSSPSWGYRDTPSWRVHVAEHISRLCQMWNARLPDDDAEEEAQPEA